MKLPRNLLAVLFPLSLWACERGEIERPGPYYPDDPLDYSETPVGQHGRLAVNEDGKLVGEDGELVQLKGVSSHWLNWEKDGYALSFAGLLWMRDNWNVSVIRAAMGVGDGQGKPVNGGYIDGRGGMEYQVKTIVEHARRLGVYVIIDWHDHYAQDHVEHAEYFFNDMAERYADYDNVIYEVYNEPLTREWNGRGPYTWSETLKPYHEKMVRVIRKHDKDGIIVLGTPNWSQDIHLAAEDPVRGDNLMYTLHFYACTHQDWLWERIQPALDAQLPVFVTEWGATDASGGVEDTTVCVDSAEQWHSLMDEHSISWAAWKLDGCNEGSCLLKTGAPVDGPWEEWTQGHGDYVVRKLRGLPVPRADAGALLDASTLDEAGARDASFFLDAHSNEEPMGPDSSTPDASAQKAGIERISDGGEATP